MEVHPGEREPEKPPTPDLDGIPPEVAERVVRFVEAARRPMTRDDPRRHHFLPVFYLKGFASTKDRIAVVGLGSERAPYVTNVINAAVVRDLYTVIDKDVGETAAVEKVLGLADAEAKPALERLTFGFLFPPSPDDRANVAIWLGLLHVRDPWTRRNFEAMADSTYKMQLSLVHDSESAAHFLAEQGRTDPSEADIATVLDAVDGLDDLEIVPSQNDLVRMVLDMGTAAAPYILRRQWTVVQFPEPGLVLPDRPLVLYQYPENRSPILGVGLGNADEILIPLDRSTALILHEDRVFGEQVMPAPPGYTIDHFNQLSVMAAQSAIYCHPDDVDRLSSLELPAPDRPLMHMTGGEWIKAPTDGVNRAPRRKSHHRYRRERSDDSTRSQ